jgi:hypothetical protein
VGLPYYKRVINEAWIARVKKVVDYCINDSLYVIINIHWDGGWLENNVTTSMQNRKIIGLILQIISKIMMNTYFLPALMNRKLNPTEINTN